MADTGDFTDEDLEGFLAWIFLSTAISGPQTMTRFARTGGYEWKLALRMWLRLITEDRIVGDGVNRMGTTKYRPRRPSDGEGHLTPATMVASQAVNDQIDAGLRDMSPEEWDEINTAVAEITADLERQRKAKGDDA